MDNTYLNMTQDEYEILFIEQELMKKPQMILRNTNEFPEFTTEPMPVKPFPTKCNSKFRGEIKSMKITAKEAPKNISKNRMLKEMGVEKVTFTGKKCVVLIKNEFDSVLEISPNKTVNHTEYFVGKSECLPEDKFDPVEGFRIAYSRAVAKRELRRHRYVIAENIKKVFEAVEGNGTYEVK